MALYYPPPLVHIGAAQPHEPKKLVPPSGPTPQNPPFAGGAKVDQAIPVDWIPPPPQPAFQRAPNFTPSGPTPQNPPFAGGAEVPGAVLIAWIPPPPLPPAAINLNPPIAGPTPQAPPSLGSPLEQPGPVEVWWIIPPPPQPPVAINLDPPIPGPAPQNPPFAGGAKVDRPVLVDWIPPPPQPAFQRAGNFTPSGPAPQNPPFMGGARLDPATTAVWQKPADPYPDLPNDIAPLLPVAASGFLPLAPLAEAVLVSWLPSSWPAQAAPQLIQSGPAPQNPPFAGGASIPEAVDVWWIPPPPAPPAAINLNPPVAGPSPQNPPFAGGAIVPEAVEIAWLPPPPQPPTAILLDPPIAGPSPQNPPFAGGAQVPAAALVDWLPLPFTLPSTPPQLVFPRGADNPPFVGGAKFLLEAQQWYRPADPQAPQSKLLSPPIAGPSPQNPPFAGGAEIPEPVQVWWIPPAPQPPLIVNLNPTITSPTKLFSNPLYIARVPRQLRTAVVQRQNRVARYTGANMAAAQDLYPAFTPQEQITVSFDFAAGLPAGVTVSSIVSVTSAVHSGTDATPSSRLIGSPAIGTAPTPQGSGIVNGAVLQKVGNAVSGVVYLLQCVAIMSTGDQLSIETHVSCQAPS